MVGGTAGHPVPYDPPPRAKGAMGRLRKRTSSRSESLLLALLVWNGGAAFVPSTNATTTATTSQPPTPKKSSKCRGRETYENWISKLFSLAPHLDAHECSMFGAHPLVNYSINKRDPNFVVLRRDARHKPHAEALLPFNAKPNWRANAVRAMWLAADKERELPPMIELVVNVADKPRHADMLPSGLPLFTFATNFPMGSGVPEVFKPHVPFPSINLIHFHAMPGVQGLLAAEFLARRPVVFFRGRFSEVAWKRATNPQQGAWKNTPRFKLAREVALARAASAADAAVLDIELTDIAVLQGDSEQRQQVVTMLARDFNITLGVPLRADQGNARMMLSVAGNGWAGTSTTNALASSACMLAIIDPSLDHEGVASSSAGEIFYPHLKPHVHFVPVNYSSIAAAVHKLNANPERAVRIAQAGARFAQDFLGRECGLDVIQALAWRYYEYATRACPGAFEVSSTSVFQPRAEAQQGKPPLAAMPREP